MDIEKWLCGLGLQQYVATFRDNAIDAEVLSELTEADLEKLGIVLGHRKRLLRAIGTLASPTGLEQAALVGLAPPIGDGAERRQLTVMFCDLVGSTALATMTTNHNSYAKPEVTLPPHCSERRRSNCSTSSRECQRLGDWRVARLPGLFRQKDGVLFPAHAPSGRRARARRRRRPRRRGFPGRCRSAGRAAHARRRSATARAADRRTSRAVPRCRRRLRARCPRSVAGRARHGACAAPRGWVSLCA